jgi:phosphatidylserine/phosphatidylglycerophosphate/cardiolipin synthase-like enzyme
MVKGIQTATAKPHYIYLLAWWLDDLILMTDRAGTSFNALMRAASKAGVQIRAMLWDQAGQKNTAEVQRISDLPTGAAILDNNTLPLGGQHQKVLVVRGRDGLIGFCGGVDINEDRLRAVSRSPGSPYHDVHCKVQGPAAHDLLDVFAQRWLGHPDHVRIDRSKGELLGLPDRLATERPGEPRGKQVVRIARTFNFIGDGKRCAKERSLRETMIAAIRSARRFIYIEDQYLVNFEAALELRKALLNIQHLTIVIAHSGISDLPMVWWARAQFIDSLMKGGDAATKVRVFYRFTPGPARFGPHSYVHAKTWVFDDELAIIGSANCNNRGWQYDSEVMAAICDRPASVTNTSFAQELRAQLWSEHLGVPKTKVLDGIASAWLWLKLPDSATVKRYDPNEGRDGGVTTLLSWYSHVDPGADDLPACGETTTTAR